MKRALYLLPALLFLVLAGYFGVVLRSGRDPSLLPSALIDKPAPPFALGGFDGAPGLSRDAIKGQVAIINFFASWCIPCRAEQPLLLRLSEQEHVPVYGIAYKDKPEDAKRFLDQLGDPYRRIGLDESGRTAIDFGVYGVPETYLIDKSGHIRFRFVGPITADALEHDLLPRLKRLGAS
ncbi:MAG TPA: DsbE family thiol:disulfide interchange protein [Stellaceae bacterium]|jgi:cytochrome c biogenesis protein CcmG/thiol:disulfide interchange protein DsbE|nr:DsbE family thiol:disulfide interchange protein [Stellaceae bacterium]